ncbi:hypothetical protein GCM10007939_07610 [Amylibacter marinus]|uniref:RDD domain-containing protein n=1 Tax=Amylibacter marinus TaxID=1475483 RepID=A0ABQ5VSS5_9RHOB|nr:RDD family protein [Amylibacter marinus]GLQ34478.1 hypothetical protein GCM10007939_07610 [Amylibacter marinus]
MQDHHSGLPDPILDAQFYAGVPFKRLIAWGVDLVIILLISLVLVVVTLGILLFLFPLLFLSVGVGYRIFMINRRSATLGMIFTGIEFRNNQGNRFTLEQSIWHTLAFSCMSISVLLQLASMAMMLFGARGQGLHDLIMGTTAINRPVEH